MRRDQFGKRGQQEQNNNDQKPDDRAVIGAKTTTRIRAADAAAPVSGTVEGVSDIGHRVCRMRGLIRP